MKIPVKSWWWLFCQILQSTAPQFGWSTQPYCYFSNISINCAALLHTHTHTSDESKLHNPAGHCDKCSISINTTEWAHVSFMCVSTTSRNTHPDFIGVVWVVHTLTNVTVACRPRRHEQLKITKEHLHWATDNKWQNHIVRVTTEEQKDTGWTVYTI